MSTINLSLAPTPSYLHFVPIKQDDTPSFVFYPFFILFYNKKDSFNSVNLAINKFQYVHYQISA